MANWRVGSQGKQSEKIVRSTPKTTPRNPESHPGAGAGNASGLSAKSAGAGSKSFNKDAKSGVDKDMRLKTPAR